VHVQNPRGEGGLKNYLESLVLHSIDSVHQCLFNLLLLFRLLLPPFQSLIGLKPFMNVDMDVIIDKRILNTDLFLVIDQRLKPFFDVILFPTCD
jgi:hypothetical protein